MSRTTTLFSGLALSAAMLVVAGCGSSGDAPDNDVQAKIKKNLAKLSAEDRALVEKQKICPVEGTPLGSMDVPIKVPEVLWNGQPVFICCDGCRNKLLDDRDKYLEKLGGK